jgi:superoxide dismutase, Cu-Zn family
MKSITHFAMAGAILLLGGATLPAASQTSETAKAQLKDSKGKDVGTAVLTQTPAGVLIKLSLMGVPAGEHAFHIHAVGKCEPPSFESAGGHFNPGHAHHGIMAGEGHAGDMPNLYVPANGALSLEVLNNKVTLDKGKPNSLFDGDGSSLVIHANVDDYKSDPAGNAGARIACGAISAGS